MFMKCLRICCFLLSNWTLFAVVFTSLFLGLHFFLTGTLGTNLPNNSHVCKFYNFVTNKGIPLLKKTVLPPMKFKKKAYSLISLYVFLTVKASWKNYGTMWIMQFLTLMDGKRISSGQRIRTLQKVLFSRTWPITKCLSLWIGPWNFSQSDRETQRDWFGKKGKSWHVSVAVKKGDDGEIEVEYYVWVW